MHVYLIIITCRYHACVNLSFLTSFLNIKFREGNAEKVTKSDFARCTVPTGIIDGDTETLVSYIISGFAAFGAHPVGMLLPV